MQSDVDFSVGFLVQLIEDFDMKQSRVDLSCYNTESKLDTIIR